jgi:hypothetical protein
MKAGICIAAAAGQITQLLAMQVKLEQGHDHDRSCRNGSSAGPKMHLLSLALFMLAIQCVKSPSCDILSAGCVVGPEL